MVGLLEQQCDLLKIDVEGSEFEILAKTPSSALRKANRVICEAHHRAGDPAVLVEILASAGFEVSITTTYSLAPFSVVYGQKPH